MIKSIEDLLFIKIGEQQQYYIDGDYPSAYEIISLQLERSHVGCDFQKNASSEDGILEIYNAFMECISDSIFDSSKAFLLKKSTAELHDLDLDMCLREILFPFESLPVKDNWINTLDKLGVTDWFTKLHDNSKSELILNSLCEHYLDLGTPNDHRPSHILESIPDKFDGADETWHSMLTGQHSDSDGVCGYVEDQYEAIRDHEPCMDKNELCREINNWYGEWGLTCRKALKETLTRSM